METLPIELLEEVVSHLLAPGTRETTVARNLQQHADIFNVRLTNQALAAAASRYFILLIEGRTWTLNIGSLNRLSNLLLNIHVAKCTTRLAFNAARLPFERDYFDVGSGKQHVGLSYDRDVKDKLEEAMAVRNAYVKSKLPAQLVKIFHRARNLKKLIIMYAVLEGTREGQRAVRDQNSISRDAQSSFENIMKDCIVDPLRCFQAALSTSRANERLESFHLSCCAERIWYSGHADSPSTTYLTMRKITHLTLDPTYFMDAALRLYCPHLKHLDLVEFERLRGRHMRTLHTRILPKSEQLRLRAMFSSLQSITITGTPELASLDMEDQPNQISASVLYSFIVYLARFSLPLNLSNFTIQRATICDEKLAYLNPSKAPLDEQGKRLDDIRGLKGLIIEELKLEDVKWRVGWHQAALLPVGGYETLEEEWEREDSEHCSRSELRSRENEIMGPLRAYVEKFVVCETKGA